ncbi:hypothetical protein XELAEV_18031338mg [Xenopus laevis]|uniref:Uncharacterized protein n=1 Tax=Xenopus laevis TaxID=8355 RepID=A0A974CME7_XENLA|nr:hypothetical protein XELAEV_18031338mg [Xenopus laevis]
MVSNFPGAWVTSRTSSLIIRDAAHGFVYIMSVIVLYVIRKMLLSQGVWESLYSFSDSYRPALYRIFVALF